MGTAIFLLTLKGKISGEIFKRLSEPDQEKVLVEIASPAAISPDERAGVMDDFLGIMQSEGIYASGGLEEAEALLEQENKRLKNRKNKTKKKKKKKYKKKKK